MFVKPPTPSIAQRRAPQQPRSKERVERILASALAEIEARGVDAATMTGVAERAGVPIGSVYQFFPNKASILAELARRYAEDAGAALTVALGPDAATAPLPALVDRLVDHMGAFHGGYPGYAVLMEAQSRDEEVAAALLGLRRNWIAHAETLVAARAPDLDDDERACVALAATHATDLLKYLPWCVDDRARARLVAETKALLLRYLAPYDRSRGGPPADRPAGGQDGAR